MKINNLNKMQIRDTHKIKDIEEYLESEVNDILGKKGFKKEQKYNLFPEYDNDERKPYTKEHTLQSPKIRDEREQYLPFNTDEIRPIINDARVSNNNNINNVLLDTLMPIIEEWLDNNLERIVHKIVKRSLDERKQAELDASRDTRAKKYYEDEYYSNNDNNRDNRNNQRSGASQHSSYNRYKN